MEIRRADQIDGIATARCCVCNAAIVPIGNGHPFVVDGPAVYCSDHGLDAQPAYSAELAEYRRWRAALDAYREWAEQEWPDWADHR